MTKQELIHRISTDIEELSIIKGYMEDAYNLGGSSEITINGHKMTASIGTMAYLCDFLDLAIRDAQTDYERIR